MSGEAVDKIMDGGQSKSTKGEIYMDLLECTTT